MFKVGLTGGIGSGKSTISKLFNDLGIDIIDADQIAHNLLKPNTEYSKKIINKFGDQIHKNNIIQRNILKEKIFTNLEHKEWLENLLHPPIIKQLIIDSDSTTSPYCVLVIPLLIEAKLQDIVDRILLVKTTKSHQIQRIKNREESKSDTIENIINIQSSNKVKQQYADDIIDNTGNIEILKSAVQTLHSKYIKLTANQ